MPVDLRLYAIVDPDTAGGHAPAELAGLAVQGGATLVQLRDKTRGTRAFVATARATKAALAPFGVPLVINDRVDVALAAGADGVHVGQDDMEAQDARRLLGPHAIVGLTVKNVGHVQAASVELIDYVGIGGVFATGSKDNPDPPIGLAGLASVVGALRRRSPTQPACGIAGITAANAADVIAAGADGVSVISALSLAPDPAAAAHKLRAIVDAALAMRR